MGDSNDDVASIDGHVFRDPEEQQKRLRFIREEGVQLLALYASIEDSAVKVAILDLVKTFATAFASTV